MNLKRRADSIPRWIRTFVFWAFTASFLQCVGYALLTSVRLASPSMRFAITQVLVVLLVAPYVSARAVGADTRVAVSSTRLLVLSPLRLSSVVLIRLVLSHVVVIACSFFSTGFLAVIFNVTFVTCLKLFVVLTICSMSGAAVGAAVGLFCRDVIFGTAVTYLLWSLLIGGVFLLAPLERYIDNIQPIIPPLLDINPVMAACNLFFDEDIFRTPLLYRLTPAVSSYVVPYPSWYRVCFVQLVIGSLFVVGILLQTIKGYKNVTA